MRRFVLGVLALHCVGIAPLGAEPVPPAAVVPHVPPNVLIVMTDDVGFASSSTFGGEIPTPTLDRLAKDGLVYTNFHTTSICSPTRAALLTGRNHHSVGFGTVADLAQDAPGYSAIMPRSARTVARVLSDAGYDTAMFGKHHNVPMPHSGPLGPYDQWANGLGFHYFYGFHGGHTDQFAPQLIENTRLIELSGEPGDGTEAGYILDRDMADRAIGWLRTQRSQHPGQPFLLYYAPGTAHAPVQAPKEWIERFRGKFDAGWDAYREATLARQKRLGIVPANTRLAPRPEGIRAWSALSADERKVAARYMEVYAAMLAFCDEQVGRILDDLRQSGQLDNTIVVFIQGDNGASQEGGDVGRFNYETLVGGGVSSSAREVARALAGLETIGGPDSYSAPPAGWAVAMNTPFPYYKVVASRLGGTRNGMVVSWPARLGERGLRGQFVHVTDIMPTILEVAGVSPPEVVDGVVQQPFDGVSFAYSFTQPNAPARHRTQYFEVFGHAAIYQDGWLLSQAVKNDPAFGAAFPDPRAPWQLYDLSRDFSQTVDVAASHPERVAAMKALWEAEATRNRVYPLITRIGLNNRPQRFDRPGRYRFQRLEERLPESMFPRINNRDWSLVADIEVPSAGGDGAIVTQGGQRVGWGLLMLQGVPTFVYRNDVGDADIFRIAAPGALEPGRRTIAVGFTADGPGLGRGGSVSLAIDGKEVAAGRVDRTVTARFGSEDATIGFDSGTALLGDYRPPFRYPGKIGGVTFELGPVLLPPVVPGE